MRDLSASWVWENPMDVHHDQSTSSEVLQFDFNIDSFSDSNNVRGST